MEKTTLTSNKEIVNKFFENFEKGNYEKVEKLLSENYKLTITGSPKTLNREEGLQLMEAYKTAFPDLKFTFQLQLADGEYVITRTRGTGTQKGEFQGIAPTNKKATINTISIQRIVKNKIVEEITEFDSLSLLQQLGALPESISEIGAHDMHLN